MTGFEQMEISGLLRDEGINRAAAHADRTSRGWSDQAFAFLVDFPRKEFMAEDVREWAESHGLPKPPSARAWGAIIVRARREGVIRPSGFANVKNPRAHRTPARVWKKVA